MTFQIADSWTHSLDFALGLPLFICSPVKIVCSCCFDCSSASAVCANVFNVFAVIFLSCYSYPLPSSFYSFISCPINSPCSILEFLLPLVYIPTTTRIQAGQPPKDRREVAGMEGKRCHLWPACLLTNILSATKNKCICRPRDQDKFP